MRYLFLLNILMGFIFGMNWNGFFPISNNIKLVTGYDSNVLRLSAREKTDAAINRNILGKAETFDSAFLRFGYSLTSTYRLSGRSSYFRTQGQFAYTDYTHTPQKSYWSAQGRLIYQRKYHQRVELELRHLNRYYLRDYKDRDVSSTAYAQCYFTDQTVGLSATVPLSKSLWAKGGYEFLKRYYNPSFAEFDLDIQTVKMRMYYKPFRWLQTGLEYRMGSANNITYLKTARSSDFDRSYSSQEIFLPLSIRLRTGFWNRVGLSYRQENRYYIAEALDDPLHAGRNHVDRKTDIWFQRNITEDTDIVFTFRYRSRKTESDYDWVGELKTFSQLQGWLTLTKGFVYDRY